MIYGNSIQVSFGNASQQLAEAMHGERSVFLGPELIGLLLGDQRSSYVLCSLHMELV
jgi:hypothetical protein